MMQTEIQEVAEPFLHGRGSSSTMPQKRNPISSEIILACSKLLREHHSSMLDAMVLDHERATGQWHVEWNAIPNSFIIASSSFRSTRVLLEGLEISPDNMKNNIDKTNGLIVAEAVMMALAPHIGRQVAHDLVYDCCRKTIKNNTSFVDSLFAEKQISDFFSKADLLKIVDPSNYLGAAPAMANNLLKKR
jgi:3-carboxy-cis,cis-muconate cycloisomerase